MAEERTIAMTVRDLKRLRVIEEVVEKKLKQGRAAELLEVSTRQVRRLMRRVKREGAQGLIHRLRGQESNRKHEEKFKHKVLELCRTKYAGFGPTLAQEKLEELNHLHINRETLRQWMLEENLWEVSKKGRQHRQWRERRACFGEMTQVDGSHHDWLEGRGPWLVLMGYIDDATNEVFARFYDYEGTIPAMDSFYRYTKRYGLPHSIYLDRLEAYHSSGKPSLEDELRGKTKSSSQFERALEELGVDVIHAQSAQAKGRIERLFKTFQDRLVKEMRLAGIRTKEEANQFLETYLPKYNRRFRVQAREQADLHRPGLWDQALRQILSIQETRVVRNDATIRYKTQLYQILNPDKSLKEVMVQGQIDGKIYIVNEGKPLSYRELKEPPKQIQQTPKKRQPKPVSFVPAESHPWRKLALPESQAKKLLAAA